MTTILISGANLDVKSISISYIKRPKIDESLRQAHRAEIEAALAGRK